MTKSRAKVLTKAERDSHRESMNIYRQNAAYLVDQADWLGAATALQNAMKHANVLSDKAARSDIFGKLNTYRAHAKRAQRNAEALPNPWTDAPEL